jgi:hypothetical protein
MLDACLEPAEKAFSYDEYTLSLAVVFLTASAIVYSSYGNAFSASSRHPEYNGALFGNFRNKYN